MAMAIDLESSSNDLTVVLSSKERDFLICTNGQQVTLSSITGKLVGLYFSGSWCGPCRQFTPKLVEAYESLYPKGDFEIVFISSDKYDESFNEYFVNMPWLAVPFSDAEARKNLKQLFKVRAIPHLVILDGTGKDEKLTYTRTFQPASLDLALKMNFRLADRLGEPLEVGKDADTERLKNSPFQRFKPFTNWNSI
ncbi:hypothetical protein MTR67_022114 [Solanum verrucosum]|uniref:protein-disulfide reductase n=1 Tax=Solanum verrucosum TaxID=315347 RepID=A0AAF0QZE4_SOLVR|nr:hypothetical protein MTR67_022114 [Solanum verrucosum]